MRKNNLLCAVATMAMAFLPGISRAEEDSFWQDSPATEPALTAPVVPPPAKPAVEPAKPPAPPVVPATKAAEKLADDWALPALPAPPQAKSEVAPKLAATICEWKDSKCVLLPDGNGVGGHVVPLPPVGKTPRLNASIKLVEVVEARVGVLEARAPVPGPAGKAGVAGAQGPAGPQGPAGSAGANGRTPSADELRALVAPLIPPPPPAPRWKRCMVIAGIGAVVGAPVGGGVNDGLSTAMSGGRGINHGHAWAVGVATGAGLGAAVSFGACALKELAAGRDAVPATK